MPTVQKKGVATIEGIPGSFDVIVWLPQTGKFADKWEKETVKDQHGFTIAKLGRDQSIDGDITMMISGVSANSPSTAAQLAAQVWPLAPLTTVTLSGFVFATDNAGGGGLNGQWAYEPGGDLALDFSKVNGATFKLEKFVDPTQNALLNTTPN